MRTLIATTAVFIALASCGTGPVAITLDRCWSVSVGDRVEGSALLLAFPDGCIECGSFVAASDKCSATPIAIGNDAAEKAFRDLLRTSSQDSMGMIHRAVSISGIAVPLGKSSKPMIRLERLLPLEMHHPSKRTSA